MDKDTAAKLILAISGRLMRSLRTLVRATSLEGPRARECAETFIDELAEAIEEVNNAFPKA